MRADPVREILEEVLPNDQSGMLRDQAHPRHAGIAVGIEKIDSAVNKNIPVVRAAGGENECTEKRELESGANHRPLPRRKLAIGNWISG